MFLRCYKIAQAIHKSWWGLNEQKSVEDNEEDEGKDAVSKNVVELGNDWTTMGIKVEVKES